MAIGGEFFGLGRASDAFSNDPEAYSAVQGDRTRQLIAQMLLARGMQPAQGQMAGRFYVPPSPLQHVGNLASAGLGAFLMSESDRKRVEMAKAVADRQKKEVDDFKQSIAPRETPVSLSDLGTRFPVTRSEMPDTFDINELQGGNTIGFVTGPNTVQTRQHAQQYGPAPGVDIPVKDRYGDEPATQDIGMTKMMPRGQDEIKMAYFDAMTRSNPRLQDAVKFMAQQDQLAYQKEQDREVKREGIETNSLMRLEQMKNTAALTAMQIDARMRAGQDATDLKKALAEQTAEIKRLDIDARKQMAADRNATTLEAARIAAGSKQDAAALKRQDKASEAKTNVDMTLNSLSNTRAVAEELLNHPGLGRITGLMGALPNFPGSDASNAQAVLDQLKAQASVQMINDMRQASKTGGAVGQVTEKEWVYLQNAAARLSQTQGTPAFEAALKDYVKQLDRVEGLITKAYQRQFGEGDGGLSVGAIEDGYRFKGGDPGDPASWEKVP